MKKRLEDLSPVEQMDLVNNEVYYSQIKADEDFWKRFGICSAITTGIMVSICTAHYIVYHPEKIKAIKNSICSYFGL